MVQLYNLYLDEPSTIADFYPMKRREETSFDAVAVDIASETPAMSATPLNSNEATLLPGQAYAIYNTLDIFGALPHDYEVVVKRAAHWAGVDENYVCSAVERFERRFLRWWTQTGKKEVSEHDEDVND